MCRNFRHFGSRNADLLIFIGCLISLNCDMTDLMFGGWCGDISVRTGLEILRGLRWDLTGGGPGGGGGVEGGGREG